MFATYLQEGWTIQAGHIKACIEILGLHSSVHCASYGWHPQQLSAGEYVAVVSREVSANLDLMSEARRRPRPTQEHKVAPDEDDDLGARAEFVDVGEVEDRSDLDVDDCPIKPEVQYQPRLRVDQKDVLGLAHRLNVKTTRRAVQVGKVYGVHYSEHGKKYYPASANFSGRIEKVYAVQKKVIIWAIGSPLSCADGVFAAGDVRMPDQL